MPRRDLSGKRALITGASQGIGFSLAVSAARRGCLVVVSARSANLLDALCGEVRAFGGQIVPVAADVTHPEGRAAMLDTAVQNFGGLDILVNNAGVGATGHFMETSTDTLRQIFEVNLFGAAELIRLCLPELRKGDRPIVVNISSVLGKRGFPGRSFYSASKFALHGLSDAIRAELSQEGIEVLVVSPGLTQTNFSKNMIERVSRMSMDHARGMTADQVAEATMNAVEADRSDITLTTGGRMLVLANRFFPWLVERIAAKRVRKMFAEERIARQLPAQTTGSVPNGRPS
jgi:short-subunit dehydrogenase